MWWDYVQQVAKGAKQADIAERAGVNQVTVSRWKKGAESARPENVAAFARAYGRPVLEAFVAAGFLTAEEADVRPDSVLAVSDLADDALIAEVARRLKGVQMHAGSGKTATVVEAQIADVWPVYDPDRAGRSHQAEPPSSGQPLSTRSRDVVEQSLRIARSNRADLNELPADLPETIRLKERADRQIESLEHELAATADVG
jgi:transcriptional regulator with XRE-family HTH domain